MPVYFITIIYIIRENTVSFFIAFFFFFQKCCYTFFYTTNILTEQFYMEYNREFLKEEIQGEKKKEL